MQRKALVVENKKIIGGYVAYCLSKGNIQSMSFKCCNLSDVNTKLLTYNINLAIIEIDAENYVDVFKIIEKLKLEKPFIKIMLITENCDPTLLVNSRIIGVDSLYYIDHDEVDFVQTVMDIFDGKQYLPAEAPCVQFGNTNTHSLTDREYEVLREVVKSRENCEIAEKLCISIDTVKFHMRELLQKTGYRSRTGLAVSAVRNHIVI